MVTINCIFYVIEFKTHNEFESKCILYILQVLTVDYNKTENIFKIF